MDAIMLVFMMVLHQVRVQCPEVKMPVAGVYAISKEHAKRFPGMVISEETRQALVTEAQNAATEVCTSPNIAGTPG